jgi:hypothetical protein
MKFDRKKCETKIYFIIFFDTHPEVSYIHLIQRIRIIYRRLCMKFYASLGSYLAVFTLAFTAIFSPCSARSTTPIKLIDEFKGTIPGTNDGDLFGYSMGINNKFFIVGSPGASLFDAEDAGAVYFFEKNVLGKWVESQIPFFIPVQNNILAYNRIVTRGDWLFVPLPGTPQDSTAKNYDGEILVFRKSAGSWNLVQTISNPQSSLLPFEGFGAYLNYSGGKWLVVGGDYTNVAYFYKLNEKLNLWELSQSIPLPIAGETFVSIDGHHALISAPQSTFPTTAANGEVYAYHLRKGIWTPIQTLKGKSPISTLYNSGDSFGSSSAIYGKWAVIGAPTDNVMSDLAGAAYFYQFNEKKKKWIQKQKVYSDWPIALFGSSVAIKGNLSIISDPGRTVISSDGTRNIFQGVGAVYKRHPVCWKVGERIWSNVESLIDPNGRAYDFLGASGLDINDHLVGIGTNSIYDEYLPIGFPGKRTGSFTPNNGRAFLYKIRH